VIELVVARDDPAGREARAVLEDLVVAHTVTVVDRAADAGLPARTRLPAVREGDRLVAGTDAVAGYLAELRRFTTEWNRFQSDACYVEDDGTIC